MWRRFIYLGILLLWMLVMCFPVASFVLAIRGQIKFGDSVRSGLRIFLVMEDDVQGVGFEWSRRLRENPQCSKTGIRYLLWKGGETNSNTDYCLCYEPGENSPQLTGNCQ